MSIKLNNSKINPSVSSEKSNRSRRKTLSCLRGKQLGVKFARQDGIEHFVADFCYRKQKLIIEIDGDIHQDKMVSENDQIRTQRLEELGYKIIRFTNNQVLNNIEETINIIKTYLN